MSTIFTTDQMGDTLEINFPPKRIVSLVPSQTEFLFDLGLTEQIIGITKFCIHPEEVVGDKPKIGGTKRFNIEKIKSLNPDLIIGNKEENYRDGVEELKKQFPVWMSDIYDLEDAFAMMQEVSRITGRPQRGEEIMTEIRSAFNSFTYSHASDTIKSVAYFIWRKPYMVAAQNTYINYMLGVFGMRNIYANLQRYPEIEPAALSAIKPDYIFLSSEPYSFGEKHIPEFQDFSPGSKILLVDGEIFSWYGSRLKLAAAYFTELYKKLS
jgi:ABC-type Fe3+-hydroxamate transport system substrate-binding protein